MFGSQLFYRICIPNLLPSAPLIDMLKLFRFLLCFRADIHISKVQMFVIDTTEKNIFAIEN